MRENAMIFLALILNHPNLQRLMNAIISGPSFKKRLSLTGYEVRYDENLKKLYTNQSFKQEFRDFDNESREGMKETIQEELKK